MIPRGEMFAVVLDLAQAIQAAAIYPEHHRQARTLVARLHGRIDRITAAEGTLRIGAVADHFVVGDSPFLETGGGLARLLSDLQGKGMEKIAFHPGLTEGELERFVRFLAGGGNNAPDLRFENIRFGALEIPGAAGEAPDLSRALPRAHVLYGAADVLAGVLSAIARESGGTTSLAGGRDIVASVIAGLHKDADLIHRLLALQAHDDYTVTHSLNVCAIVTAQAMRLGLPEERLREIGLAALFHDVGKELVPPGILRKPGRIDPVEFALMAEHPVRGAALLRRIDCGSDLPVIVCFEHHMKNDLSGYPKTAHGKRPHPVSLMTQIADVYDALRTHRPYRDGLPLETALSIMEEGRGTEFDASLFANFLGTLPAGQSPAGA